MEEQLKKAMKADCPIVKKVSFNLESEILDEMDKIAQSLQVSRGRFIRGCLSEIIRMLKEDSEQTSEQS